MPRACCRLFVLSVLLVGTALPGSATGAEGTPGAAGYWQGAITLPSGDLGISLTFVQGPDRWTALLDLPRQGIRRMELAGVQVEGNSVACRMPGVPGDPTFHGRLSEDGVSIGGTFVQGGESFDFIVSRTEPPADAGEDIYADFVRPGVPGKGLIGKWRGLLRGGPMKLRMELSITVRGGALIGSLTSIDQDHAAIPISNAMVGKENSVRFEAPLIGGLYRGVLSEDGAEMIGTWSQEGQQIRLDLHRTGEPPTR